MSIGGTVGVATVAAVTVGRGESVSVRVMPVGLCSVAVAVSFAGTIGRIGTDRQVALHVVLNRSVSTVHFAEQTVVRILAMSSTAWGVT